MRFQENYPTIIELLLELYAKKKQKTIELQF